MQEQKDMGLLLFGISSFFFGLMILEYYIIWNGGGGEHKIWERLIPILYYYRLPIRFGGILIYTLALFIYFNDQGTTKKRKTGSPVISMMAIFLSFIGIGLMYAIDLLPFFLILYPFTIFLCLLSIPIWMMTLVPAPSKKIQNPRKRNRTSLGFNLRLKNGWINLPNPFRGTLVIGAAGSGKSYSIAEPLIEQAIEKNYCGIIYDFKFPTLSHTVYSSFLANTRKRAAVQLRVVSFTDLSRSARVNPLKPENLPVMAYAEEFSLSLISNLMPESIKHKDFWIRSAHAILTATIWYMKKHHPKQSTLPHVVAMICNKNYESLVRLLEQDPETAGLIASLSVALKAESAKQISGMMGTLQIALSRLNNPQIAWVLSGDDFSLDLNNPEFPVFLCIGTSPSLSDTLAPVVSLIITVSLKLMNQQGKHHSLVLLDEAPTLYIPKFEQIPATARSNKIATVYMAQDISQMVQSYGQVNAEVILSNLNNQLFGRVANQKTAEYISRIFGKGDKEVIEFSHSSSGAGTLLKRRGKSYSHRIRDVELIRPQELMSLGVGEFVGTTVGQHNESFWGEVKRRATVESEIPPFAQVSEREVLKNFERIHSESGEVLREGDFV